jgi:circadian clock protein KaiB
MPGESNFDGPYGDSSTVESADTLAEFEKLVADLAQPHYVFRLYVSGSTPRSTLAIANVRAICERYLPGRFDLEVVDVYQQPAMAKSGQVVAVPTLIKELPLPAQRFVGDMSNTERIVIGLNLQQ